jgi:hypothetical protein
MLLSVNHEIAPAEQALGMNSNCGDCHGGGQVDFPALGWTDDPFNGGERVGATPSTYIDLPSPTIE